MTIKTFCKVHDSMLCGCGSSNIATSKFTKIPISEATIIPKVGGYYELTANSWWATTDDDCLLFYGRGKSLCGKSKQCNSNKDITDAFVAAVDHPATKAVFLDSVWIPHNCIDY